MQIRVSKQKKPGTLRSPCTSTGLLQLDHHVRKNQPSILLNPYNLGDSYNCFLCSLFLSQSYARSLSHSPQPANAGLHGKAILGLPTLLVICTPLPMGSSPYAMTHGDGSIKALLSYLVLDCDGY